MSSLLKPKNIVARTAILQRKSNSGGTFRTDGLVVPARTSTSVLHQDEEEYQSGGQNVEMSHSHLWISGVLVLSMTS